MQLLKKTSVLFLAVMLLGFTNPNVIEVSAAVPGTANEGTAKNVFSYPDIGYLNNDVVAWAGAGNAVVLDAGGNAFVRDGDFEPLNGGNGNWASAVLRVDRAGAANAGDIFGFNFSGTSFTASNGNLQVANQTFATYTNSSAELLITFTSSGTIATTALVDQVLRRITYRNDTPAGDAKIRVSLLDGVATTAVGVTVTAPMNASPVLALIGDKSVNEGTLLTFTATATDDGNPNGTLTYSLSGAPSGAQINAVTGVFTWRPTETQGPGSYRFTIAVSDGELTDQKEITVTVNEVNVAPVANDDSYSVNEDDVLTVSSSLGVLANDTDTDLPAGILTAHLITGPSHGTLTLSANGSFGYTPNANFNGTDSFTYKASDGVLVSSTATVMITVDAVVPGAPTAATATGGNTQASVAFAAPVLTGGAAITSYTVTSIPGGITATGASSPLIVTGLTNGVSYTFNVTATNSIGTGSASGASNAVVPNGAPIISGTPALSINQDVAYSFIPTAADNVGDTLTFSITNKPTWATFDTETGELFGTPCNSDVGTTTGIVISVSDGTLNASLPAFALTVVNVNDEPTISMATAPTHINQGEFYDYTPIVNDPDGDVLLFDGVNLPGWLEIDSLTGRIYGTPGNDNVGTHPFESFIRVSDDGGVNWVWSESDFFFTVVNVNDAPTITGSPASTIRRGETYSFEPSAEDIDGDQLTFSILNKPTWANFDTSTGVLTGTPLRNDEGLNSGIVISVSDSTVSVALPAFGIQVESAPAITGITFDGASFVYDASAKSLAISGTLPDGASVSYAANSRADAGTQTVTATINGGDQYSDMSLTAQLTITKADIPGITFTGNSFVYDGTVQSLAIVGDLPDGASVVYANNGRTVVGSQTVTANIAGGVNYKDQTLRATLVITKADIPGITFTGNSFVYDGTARLLAIVGDLPDGASVVYANNDRTDVGSQIVTANIAGGVNYKDQVLTATLVITKADIPGITFTGNNFVYDGTAKSLAITGTLPDGASVSYADNSRRNAGTQTITATIDGGNNYKELVLKAELNIQKATALITADAVQNHIFNGSVKNVVASLNHSETGLTYSAQQGYSDAGTYTIEVSAKETVNYLSATKAVSLVISPSDFNGLTFKDKTVTYDGKVQNIVLEGSPAGSIIDYTISGQTGNSQTNAGTYAITAKMTNPNYTTKTMTATLIIKKAAQQITFEQIGTIARNANRVAMKVNASSGLPVTINGDDALVATVDGNDLLVHRLGTIRLTAMQAGNNNYESAASVSITVQVAEEAEGPIRVHPALSPNGDGINDFLILEGVKDYAENKLKIVTRSGLVVFKIDNYDNDSKVFRGIGNTNAAGGVLPEGTYFYILEYKDGGKWKAKKGWFVLKL